jgi:hypothetical protein
MRFSLPVLIVVLTLGTHASFAQGGGKAEPSRITFAAGSSSKTISGTLSVGQEAEYVFAASKGQTVTVRNSNRSLFDFRVFNEEFDFETEFESSQTLTFQIPETGDYLFYVRKKAIKTPRTARYSLTLTIE